jgi:hypothetical protein
MSDADAEFKDQVITKDAMRVTVRVTDVERMELFKSPSGAERTGPIGINAMSAAAGMTGRKQHWPGNSAVGHFRRIQPVLAAG